MSDQLFDLLAKTDEGSIPPYADSPFVARLRTPGPGAEQAAPFPPQLVQKPGQQPFQ